MMNLQTKRVELEARHADAAAICKKHDEEIKREKVRRVREGYESSPHIKKNKLRKNGLLPESITCGRQLFEDGCARLSHEDMENVMDELAVQVADDLQMSDFSPHSRRLGLMTRMNVQCRMSEIFKYILDFVLKCNI